MTIKELQEKTGRSRSHIYKKARELGRLPTIEELKEAYVGRPKKYVDVTECIKITNPADKENPVCAVPVQYWKKIPIDSIILNPDKEYNYLSLGLEIEGRIVKRTNLYSFTPGDEKHKSIAMEYAHSDWVALGLDQEEEVRGKRVIEIFKLTKIN